jgi:hypothetical protein
MSLFYLVRSLASIIKSPPTMIWTHLFCIGFVIKHLQFVLLEPFAVSENERVQHLINLKKILKSVRHRGWRYFFTGDRSWFYLTIVHEAVWTRPEVAPLTIPKNMISSPKPMLIISGCQTVRAQAFSV